MAHSAHFCPEVKRTHAESHPQIAGAAWDLTPNRALSDGPGIVVGVGADDVKEEERGPGTKYLLTELLWGLRDENFERQAVSGSKFECPSCHKMMRYYCERCLQVVGDRQCVPDVQLPLDVVVVQHQSESRSKSTAVYGHLVSNQIRICTYPDLPELNPEDTVVLFPGKESLGFEEVEWGRVRRAVLIDSTWITTHQLLRDPRIACLPSVRLSHEQTTFWRYHAHGSGCLSTIECIFHLLRQLRVATHGDYKGEYDGVLFYYAHYYRLIQMHYLQQPNRSFVHKRNYIHYERAAAEAASLGRLSLEHQAAGPTVPAAAAERDAGTEGGGGGGSCDKPAAVTVAAARAKATAEGALQRFFAVSPAPWAPGIVLVEAEARKLARAVVAFRVAPEAAGRVTVCQVRYNGVAQKQQHPLFWDPAAAAWVPSTLTPPPPATTAVPAPVNGAADSGGSQAPAHGPSDGDGAGGGGSGGGGVGDPGQKQDRMAAAEEWRGMVGCYIRRMQIGDAPAPAPAAPSPPSVAGMGGPDEPYGAAVTTAVGEEAAAANTNADADADAAAAAAAAAATTGHCTIEVRIRSGGSGWSAWSEVCRMDPGRIRDCLVAAAGSWAPRRGSGDND